MTAFPDQSARSADEAAFLKAILTDLRDDHPKLVYADWLDDRGDPRGEFLRRFTLARRADGDLPAPPTGTPAGWLELTGCDLLDKLREFDLTHLTEVLLRLARPTIALVAEAVEAAAVPVGASKFGGDPDLAAGAAWPADRTGPLPFLGQINLIELAGSPVARELPPAGLLSVFYDGGAWGDDDQGWRLVFTPGAVPLTRRSRPDAFEREYPPETNPCRLVFVEGLSLPGWDSSEMEQIDFREDGMGPRWDAYFDRLLQSRGHHLLGYSRPVQSDPVGEGQRHLLSLDSDDTAGWCWGDVGKLYFSIDADELAAGRLADGLRFEMQCS